MDKSWSPEQQASEVQQANTRFTYVPLSHEYPSVEVPKPCGFCFAKMLAERMCDVCLDGAVTQFAIREKLQPYIGEMMSHRRVPQSAAAASGSVCSNKAALLSQLDDENKENELDGRRENFNIQKVAGSSSTNVGPQSAASMGVSNMSSPVVERPLKSRRLTA